MTLPDHSLTDALGDVTSWGSEPPDLTRVDLSEFLPLKAKIDRIDILCKEGDLTAASLLEMRSHLRDTTIVAPKGRRWGHPGHPWLAFHDLSLRDLHYLTDRFYDSRVFHLEVAVDAKLPPGANDLTPLKTLKAQLRHAMHPQQHDHLTDGRRRYYAIAHKRYRDDGLGTPLPDTQIIWEGGTQTYQMAVYIKSQDKHHLIDQPWVRMEARMRSSGPGKAGLGRLGMMANFVPSLRTHLSDLFFVAKGFKNLDEIAVGPGIPKDPWKKWGAQWTADGKARLEPDQATNRKIGLALNDLRSSLKRLKPPRMVAGRYAAWINDMTY